MNKHIIIDKLTAGVGALVAGKRKFFSKSIESPELERQVANVDLECPPINGVGIYEINAKTQVGDLDPAFQIVQWKGNEFPFIIYHHGNNERPFDFSKTAKNSFFKIFMNKRDSFNANLIVVRAPFHNCSLKHYQNAMVELSKFTAMIASSVKLNEEIINKIRIISSKPVITSGISLGGWVSNLHRAVYNTSTAYAPLMAGTFLGELFLKSRYRKMASDIAINNPEVIKKVLNFDGVFKKRNSQNLFPLLSKYDQFIEYSVQRESYNGYPIKLIDCGHVTGAVNTDELRKHFQAVIEACSR